MTAAVMKTLQESRSFLVAKSSSGVFEISIAFHVINVVPVDRQSSEEVT